MDLAGMSDNFGKDLAHCFQTFVVVHQVCDSLGVVRRIAEEMLEDFKKDGVAYLEIRTVFSFW